ncbi:hypothetical protein PPS11_20718 [Pseudomonas putida S11]|nr:hypothetical protein PPS11_20718 [Pseudomonas putida S11]
MPALDATLTPWPELAARHPCDALLLGNGASRVLWKPFGYFSLFEEAQRAGRKKGLAVSDQALFKSLGTELFEPVLSALNTTVRTNAALAINSTAPLNRYYSIKEALIHAVRTVHLPWPLMPATTLATLNQAPARLPQRLHQQLRPAATVGRATRPAGFRRTVRRARLIRRAPHQRRRYAGTAPAWRPAPAQAARRHHPPTQRRQRRTARWFCREHPGRSAAVRQRRPQRREAARHPQL